MVDENATELLVVGAGVIGLSCAWRAAQDGRRVTILDPAPASGASWVAGGMLAPVTEAWPGEEELLALGVASVSRWPAFAAELADAAGRPAGLRTDGTIVAATGSGDRAELDTLAAHLARLGRPVDRLTGRELRRLEPGLGPEVRGGLSVPDDLAVETASCSPPCRSRPSGPVRCSSTPRWRPCWTTGRASSASASPTGPSGRRAPSSSPRGRTPPGCTRRCTVLSGR